MSDGKEKIKQFLKTLHLYEPVRKLVHAKSKVETNNRVQSVLGEETQYAFDRVHNRDTATGSLKISIHGIEKNLVKGSKNYQNLEKQCISIIDKSASILTEYDGTSVDSDIVKEAVGMSHLLINESAGVYDCASLRQKLDEFYSKFNISDLNYHEIKILNEKKENIDWIDAGEYRKYVECRHSVRETTEEIISIDEMREIVSVAQICPSACNRQSTKVYYTSDSEKIRALFPDPVVSKDIYNILVVTVNKSYYATSEVLQAWIDGGIFLESMIMALHSHRLGACLFQCLKGTKRYYEVKKAVGIPENEDIVSFIGYGRLKDEYKVIASHSKEVDEVLVDFSNGGGYEALSCSYSFKKHQECAA